jgi:anti-sigma regulatory factor (Ser/Thr protein kinase)
VQGAESGVVGDRMEVTRDFPRRSDQAPKVRVFVRHTLTEWGVRRAEDVVLIVSELFSNAVLHGAGAVEVRLSRLAGRLRVEVLDEGTGGMPHVPTTLTAGTVTGRGLRIVDRLATEWGTTRDAAGRTAVWAELG